MPDLPMTPTAAAAAKAAWEASPVKAQLEAAVAKSTPTEVKRYVASGSQIAAAEEERRTPEGEEPAEPEVVEKVEVFKAPEGAEVIERSAQGEPTKYRLPTGEEIYAPASTMYKMGYKTPEEYIAGRKGTRVKVDLGKVEWRYGAPYVAVSTAEGKVGQITREEAIRLSGLESTEEFRRMISLGLIPEGSEFVPGEEKDSWKYFTAEQVAAREAYEAEKIAYEEGLESREAALGKLAPYGDPEGGFFLGQALLGTKGSSVLPGDILEAGFTQAQLGEAQSRASEISLRGTALRELAPYYKPEEVMAPYVYGPPRPAGYGLGTALESGVLPATILTAGFTGEQLEVAQAGLTPTIQSTTPFGLWGIDLPGREEIPLYAASARVTAEKGLWPVLPSKEAEVVVPVGMQAFVDKYYAERGWKRPHRGVATSEELELEDVRLREASGLYQEKYGVGAVLESGGIKLLSTFIMPARVLYPEVTRKDISPVEWIVGGGQVALVTLPLWGPSVGGGLTTLLQPLRRFSLGRKVIPVKPMTEEAFMKAWLGETPKTIAEAEKFLLKARGYRGPTVTEAMVGQPAVMTEAERVLSIARLERMYAAGRLTPPMLATKLGVELAPAGVAVTPRIAPWTKVPILIPVVPPVVTPGPVPIPSKPERAPSVVYPFPRVVPPVVTPSPVPIPSKPRRGLPTVAPFPIVSPLVGPTPVEAPVPSPSPISVPVVAPSPFPASFPAFEPYPGPTSYPVPTPYVFPVPEPFILPSPAPYPAPAPAPVPPPEPPVLLAPPPSTPPPVPRIPPPVGFLWPGWPRLGRGAAARRKRGLGGLFGEKGWVFPELFISFPEPFGLGRKKVRIVKRRRVPYGAKKVGVRLVPGSRILKGVRI